jgi:hypothetical protein
VRARGQEAESEKAEVTENRAEEKTTKRLDWMESLIKEVIAQQGVDGIDQEGYG